MEEQLEQLEQLFNKGDLFEILALKGIALADFRLTDNEIQTLVDLNSVFVATPGPSSRFKLKNVQANGLLTLIHFERNMMDKLNGQEVSAIILHEIWHALNPDEQGIGAEFQADQFANQKGYGRGIIEGLRKGLKYNWIGFDKDECDKRIERLEANLINYNEDDEERDYDLPTDGLEQFELG